MATRLIYCGTAGKTGGQRHGQNTSVSPVLLRSRDKIYIVEIEASLKRREIYYG